MLLVDSPADLRLLVNVVVITHGYLDTLDRNEKTKVYKCGPVFICDAANRLK